MAGHGRHTTLPLAYLFSFEKMESYVLQLTLSEWCTVYLTMELNFLKGSTGGGTQPIFDCGGSLPCKPHH